MENKVSDICSDLQQTAIDAAAEFGGMTIDQLNWKPSPKNWSIAQCFEHLIVTNNLYLPNIQRVIDGKHRNNFFSMIPFLPDLIGVLMKNCLNPDQARKMKTFKMFEPNMSDISATIIDDFAENQQKLIAMIKAVKDFDIRKIKIPEPLTIALNIRLSDAFEILTMHEQRHLRQAKRVMQAEGFPK